MIKSVVFICGVLLLISCTKEVYAPKAGKWKASLLLDEGRKIPFLFQYNKDNTLVISNASEEIEVTDISIFGDSIIIQMPVFEGFFKGVFSDSVISGDFIKPSLKRIVPFEMLLSDEERVVFSKAPEGEITGNWETVFSPDSAEDRYIAKGIFNQIGNKVTGTFRTTTGDYRYLEGAINGDSLKLSAFDGAHAFLFEAKATDSTLNGMFYSGNHWKEPFVAKRNDLFELPKADSLTFLKEGYERFEFSFPDLEGNLVSLEDEKYKNKVVIVQIMGTWCPNCLDETKYYSKYFRNNKNDDLEIIALAFEYAPSKEKALASINRFIDAVDVSYPILLAQHGSSSKTKANEKLPMLTQVLSYPTTVFIDKTGKVRKIHTGFNGPATGEKYDEFVVEFESFVSQLLEE
jgi:peroxiredoxin